MWKLELVGFLFYKKIILFARTTERRKENRRREESRGEERSCWFTLQMPQQSGLGQAEVCPCWEWRRSKFFCCYFVTAISHNATSEKLDRRLNWDLNLGTLIWNASVSSRILTTALNAAYAFVSCYIRCYHFIWRWRNTISKDVNAQRLVFLYSTVWHLLHSSLKMLSQWINILQLNKQDSISGLLFP